MGEQIEPAPGRPYATLVADRTATILDVPTATIETLYKTHGAVLLRGFDVDVALLGRFADRLCVAPMPNRGALRRMLDPTHNIQTTAAGVQPFPLHPELSREPWRPDIAMFACLTPPGTGGETLICDGIALAAALPPPIYRAFADRRLRYIYAAAPEVLEFWLGTTAPTDTELAAPPADCPFTFTRIDGRIMREFSRPALHKPMFAERPAFANFLLFARYASGLTLVPVFDDGSEIPAALAEVVRVTGKRLSVAIPWRAKDLLLLDNSRFMHGRNAIVDEDERRIISYFGYLRFAAPDSEEPREPPWRRPGFNPPVAVAARTDAPQVTDWDAIAG